MRHFQAKEIADSGKLGGYFVEARYHLVQANREAELGRIASRFESFLKTKYSSTSPVPDQLEEINERIATLMALLETPGAKGLEFYLSRLYVARGSENDLRKALEYIRRATQSKAPADNWVLRLRLEARFNTPLQVGLIAREAISKVTVDDASKIYSVAGSLLAQADNVNEAIALLKGGIDKIPADKGLVSLYQSAGELLARTGKIDEAIVMFKDGIAKIPADQNVFSLYTYCSYQLARLGRYDEAIELLRDGIAKIPLNNMVIALYMTAANLLSIAGRYDEEIRLLQDGIKRFPVGTFQRYKLFEPILNIFFAQQNIRAIEDYLTQANVLHMEEQQMVYCKAIKLVIMRQWESAAIWIQEESVKFPFYRPLLQLGVFCWLCTGNFKAAGALLQNTQPQMEPYDSLNWLKTWICLKTNDIPSAKESLSLFLGRPVNDYEVSEHFLIRLWDSPPKDLQEKDLAYQFPILPKLLTGLSEDAVRLPYGPSVLSTMISSQNQPVNHHSEITPVPTSPSILSSHPTWMDDILNPTKTKPRVDVGIVIALDEEFRELAPQINFKAYYNQDIKQYYYLFERGIVGQEQTPYRCVVTVMGAMGPTDAGIVGDRLISQFTPKTIISIGIAGSMDKDVLVGNVVVADQTDEYLASSKAIETSDKQDWDFQLSGNPFKSDPTYVAHAMHLKYAHKDRMQEWERNCRQYLLEKIGSVAVENLIRERLISDFPEIQTGRIASGQTVGAAKQFVQWLKEKHDRKLLALEMESAGVLNAAHKRAVSSLIIRGISDYSDERKNKLDGIGQGVLRRYAMNNALSLLWLLMDLGLI